jgi:CheY-like chemotaxis protein
MSTSTMDEKATQVLIVEDDEDSRRALAGALQHEGYRVASVGSCEAALEYLGRFAPPRVIVLDLRMPGMEGWDFRRRQKQDPRLAPIPVISVSAAGKLVDVDMALRKPLDYDELLSAVASFVEKPGNGKTPKPEPGQ